MAVLYVAGIVAVVMIVGLGLLVRASNRQYRLMNIPAESVTICVAYVCASDFFSPRTPDLDPPPARAPIPGSPRSLLSGYL